MYNALVRVFEQDTAHIHRFEHPIMVMELAIGNLHLLARDLHARLSICQPQPSQTSWHLKILEYHAQYARVSA